MHRLGSIGGDAQVAAEVMQGFPQFQPPVGGHGDLIAEFARKTDAIDARGDAGQLALGPLHEGQGALRQVDGAGQAPQQFARLGSGDGDLGELLGQVGGIDAPVPPFALQPVLHMAVDAVGPAGGGVAQPGVARQARDDAVIHQEAVLAAHQAIAAFADRQRRHHVGIHHVQEPPGIRPLDQDLAQGRGVQRADPVAHRQNLSVDGPVPVLASAGIAVGAAPVAHGFEGRAVAGVPVVHRRLAQRLEGVAPGLGRDGAKGQRGIGRAEGGRAGGLDRLAQRVRQHRQAVDVADFALVGGHAQRGVSLGVFDAGIAFAGGQFDIGDLHVVLEIQPHLGAQPVGRVPGHHPDGQGRALGPLQIARAAQIAIGGAEDRDHGFAIRAQRRAVGIGAEHRLRLVPGQPAAAMAVEMDHRRPAARHRHHIAVQRAGDAALAGLVADRHAFDMGTALDLGHGLAGHDRNIRRANRLRQIAAGLGAGVDDRHHLQPRTLGDQRRAIGVVVVGDDHDPPARRHAVIADEIAHGGCQHHPRQVVAGEGQRAFQRAGRGDDVARADAPQPLARDALVRVVIGQRLARQQIAVIVEPGRHGVAAQGDVGAPAQVGQQGVDGGLTAVMVGWRSPAPDGVLFQHDHAPAGLGRIAGRRQPGDAAAHHHRFGKAVGLFITVGIGIGRRPAQARAAADDRLEQVLPEGARMDEGLVVKARGQQRRQPVGDRAQIGVQRGPAVLAAQHHARHQGRGAGPLVRFEPAALAQPEQGVRFLGPRGEGPARAVILEGPAHQHLAVGQQRRGQRVALHAAQVPAVEAEGKLPGAVDQAAAAGQAEGGRMAHTTASDGCGQSGTHSGRAWRALATISSVAWGVWAL